MAKVNATESKVSDGIDDSLYSRQRYVLGDAAMHKLSKADVLLSGLGGLGVEIAKNVILAGPRSITLHDTKLATLNDLSSQFYIQEQDVGKNRALVSTPRLAELNPYVKVQTNTNKIEAANLSFLDQFKCVILTEGDIELAKAIDDYCHGKDITFIMADTYGIAAWIFVDCGPSFEVFDKNGEENAEVLIANITQGTNGIVTCLENQRHGLETGDVVQFREVKGMAPLNDTKREINVINPSSFSIGDTSTFPPYVSGGIATQVKTDSLRQSISKPEFLLADLAKFANPDTLHVGMLALHQFVKANNKLPGPWNKEDADEFVKISESLKTSADQQLDEKLLRAVSHTAAGQLAPIAAFLGGFAAQECMKALTGKFTPLKQWYYYDAIEVLPQEPLTAEELDASKLSSKRSAAQVLVLGKSLCQKLENLRVFTVGSGAIGCEMVKNYAMLGVSCGEKGRIYITDNDLIEKSNLNRQFLFRERDLQKPKSATAAAAVRAMNPSLQIDAHLHRVGEATEHIYNNEFFEGLDLVVNALDNVAARMYVDMRIVANERPLLESGTLGTKGHVQVILPHKTESYTSQHDPPEKGVPFCTLKSFPNVVDHCIQWSRDKFEKLFVGKPHSVNKVFEGENYIESLQGTSIKPVKTALKLLDGQPKTFEECIAFARFKFENYYKNSILQLLETYPPTLALKDGTLFWTSPKRLPTPVYFSAQDPLHLDFIIHTAYLVAKIFRISVPEVVNREEVAKVCDKIVVPEFQFKTGKKIETDPNAPPPKEEFDPHEFTKLVGVLQQRLDSLKGKPRISLQPEQFEKDDDTNHHIDFIAAATNLRARNYTIQESDRLKIKRIAGNIIPAIATTTSVVSGLVALELVKYVVHYPTLPLEPFRNNFLNLALPYFAPSEPGPAPRMPITATSFYTLWDKWVVKKGDLKEHTLQDFNALFEKRYKLKVNGVFHDVAIVYMAIMPAHAKKLPMKMKDIIKHAPTDEYVDLVLTFSDENGEEANGPSVRYYFEGTHAT